MAGVHRARHLTKHLPAFGWEPTILSVAPEYHVEALDHELTTLLPEDLSRIECKALPAEITKYIGVYGDIGIRGLPFIARALLDQARKTKPDLVMITGSPFYPMLLTSWIKRKLEVPVLLDFQDPWVSAEGSTRARWTKGWAAHRLAVALEPFAVKDADVITSVSDLQNMEMAARYPLMDPGRMAAIPIGGDPDDFGSLRAHTSHNTQLTLTTGLKHFVYVGTFLPRSGPLVKILFRAVRALKEERQNLSSVVKFTFVGTSNQPGGPSQQRVKPIAEAEGVGDLVDEYADRVPFIEALSLLANADGLLMIGSTEPHYTASKIYPNLMAARPYLSIFHVASSAHAILKSAGGGAALSFNGDAALNALENRIKAALVNLIDTPEAFGKPNPDAYAPYTAQAVAGQFADVFTLAAKAAGKNK